MVNLLLRFQVVSTWQRYQGGHVRHVALFYGNVGDVALVGLNDLLARLRELVLRRSELLHRETGLTEVLNQCHSRGCN